MKKMLPTLAVGALALTLLVPSASFAATTNPGTDTTSKVKGFFQTFKVIERREDGFSHEKIMELVQKYAPELSDEFQAAFDQLPQMKILPKLDEATQKKLEQIEEQIKAGTLTKEQAAEQLKALGIKAPIMIGKRMEMDQETKEKIAANKEKMLEIGQQVKDGTLTREQAQEQLEALGIKGPFMIKQKPVMDEATKEKIDANIEKIKEIGEQVKAGTLTEEQAKEQMEALGFKGQLKIRHGGKMMGQDNLFSQLNEAVKADDAAKIKEILTQMLTDLQNKVQDMAQDKVQ